MRRFLSAGGAALLFALRVYAHSDVAVLANQARADTLRGNYKAAAQDYDALLKAGADSPQLRSNLGMVLYLAGDGEAALTELRVALREAPELAGANLFAGLSLIRIGRPRDALPLLRAAESAQPNMLSMVLALGRAYVALHNIPEARKTYQRATEINPGSAEAWYGLGVTSRELADDRLHRVASNAQDREAAESRPELVAARADLSTAERALARALELDPDGPHARMVLGEAFRDAGQLDASVEQYQAILRNKPDYAPAYLGLANTYWKFGKAEEAIAALKKLMDLSPDDPEGNAIMASLLVSKHQMTEARPFVERALSARPTSSLAHVALAKIYLAAGEPLRALPELRQAAQDDVNGSYHYILAETLRKVGRTAEAAAAFEKYRRLRAGENNQ